MFLISDETELTRLTGEQGKYRRLVEGLFQTEFGSVTWGEVKGVPRDEFLDAYSSGRRAVRDKLAAWVRYYELDDRFIVKQAPQQKCIFSHGLPELGPVSENTKFTSNPSIPTEEQHAAAHVQISVFMALSDLRLGELPYPKTNVWNRVDSETGNLGGYSSEADVNSHVKNVIDDVLESLGIRRFVTIRQEVEVMRTRPDFMLIRVNGHPVGTIEGKQPGKDAIAMEHPNILGEVYDQLMHLRSIFRVDTPFAILTCYNQWRICWLNEPDSIQRAAMETLSEPVSYVTPMKRKQGLANSSTIYEDINLEDTTKKESPPLPPTPSREIGMMRLQDVDVAGLLDMEGDFDNEDELRSFCGTNVMEWNDRSLPKLLTSLIKKMTLARQGDKPTVLRLANETTSAWKKAPAQSNLDFSLCISAKVKNFLLWEDLGHGADGRAFLVSGGTKGAVGVLKFFFADPDRKAQHEEHIWKKIYSHLPPVPKTIRIVQVMGQKALLMPWFQSPKRTQSTLDAVEKTLKEDFMDKGFRHDDVAWRNVGVYCENGQTKAVVFDMQKVRCVETHEDWVTSAVASLSQKLADDDN